MIQNFGLIVVAVSLLALPALIIKLCIDDMKNDKKQLSKS